MIDASRSPRPLWQRVATLIVLAGSIAVLCFLIWNKELHHPSSSPAHRPAPTAFGTGTAAVSRLEG